MNDQPVGIATSVSFDFASKSDRSVETWVHKHKGTLSFIPLSRTLSTLEQLHLHMMNQVQKQNRQLLPGTYISTLSL